MNGTSCDIDRWPLCCKQHRLEVQAEMAADAVAAAKDEGCTWLVMALTDFGDPSDPAMYDPETGEWMGGYPDSPADLYTETECGAKVTYTMADNGSKGWSCENGHAHWEYGSPNQQAEEFNEWAQERHEAMTGGGWD